MMDFIQMYGGQIITAVSTLLGASVRAVLGYKLKSSDEKTAKQQKIRATWRAISAEVEACRRLAEAYLTPNESGAIVSVPQWRLPDDMLTSSVQALLADGDPTHPEVDALLNFHTEADSLNRGINLVQEELAK